MQMQTMETALRNELLEGEEFIWSGSPVEYEKGVTSSRRRLQNRAGMCIVLGLVLMLAAMIVEIAIDDLPTGRESFILIPGFLLFAAGIYLYFVTRLYGFLFSPELYAITNLRIIMFSGSNYQQIMSFNRRAIRQVSCSERPDGSGDLLFSGTSVASGMSIKDTRRKKRQYVLRAIPYVRLVEQELLERMGQVKDQ